MSEQNAKIAGLVFKEVVEHQGPHDDIPVLKAWMVPYHEGEENRAIDEIKSKFNKPATKGIAANLLSKKNLELKIKTLEEYPRHERTVEELRKALSAVENRIALKKNPLGAHVSASSEAAMKQKFGLNS